MDGWMRRNGAVLNIVYTEEELQDALVVDVEGYVCGRVAGFTVEPDLILVNLYDYEVKTSESPDEEGLIERLMEFMPQKRLFHHKLDAEELYSWVRETLHLSSKEPITLERMVECAKNKGIVVPCKNVEMRVRVDRGSFEWPAVEKVGFTELGKCIILNRAMEAEKRSIALSSRVNYKSTDYLKGRVVVDSEAKIVGSALKFLVGSVPGVLVCLERAVKVEQVDVEALKTALIPSRFKDSEKLLSQVKKDLNLKVVTDDDLESWARKTRVKAPSKQVEHREQLMELRVNWESIVKIGDVVVLKEPIEAISDKVLSSEQYPMNALPPPMSGAASVPAKLEQTALAT